MQRTPLYDCYAALRGKVVDFNGWALPVQFSGIVDEHLHTRRGAGVFDCSHMGEFFVRGATAIANFSALTYSDYTALSPGRCRYSALLNDNAGIIDDCVGLRLNEEELYVVTNAGPLEQVAALLLERAGAENVSAFTAKIDVQGPEAHSVLQTVGIGMPPLKYWQGARAQWRGKEIVVTRAGYTGELGYELFVPNEIAAELWDALLAAPAAKPCGLGARDTLRSEVGYPLNGEDLAPDKTPLESGMERFVMWETDFPGKDRLEAQRDAGSHDRLVAIQSSDRRAPRHGFELTAGGTAAGVVTSGTFGPSVGTGVGLARVRPEYTAPGTALEAGPRGLAVTVVEIPIYKGGTCRVSL